MTEPKVFSEVEYFRLKAYLIDQVTRQAEGEMPVGESYQFKMETWLGEAFDRTNLNLNENLKTRVFNDVMSELVGYGPLEPLLNDPENNEIMVYGPKQIYVERKGKLVDVDLQFDDEAHLMRIIDRMLHPIGRQVNIDTPTADARLPDGSRVHIVIPPVSIDGPCITIRKFLVFVKK